MTRRVGSNRGRGGGGGGVNEWKGVVVATGKAYAANLCNILQHIKITEVLWAFTFMMHAVRCI